MKYPVCSKKLNYKKREIFLRNFHKSPKTGQKITPGTTGREETFML
jgi:hypothetical protein